MLSNGFSYSLHIDRGEWVYQGMRPDKAEPNHINVVLDTIEVLAQNITREDLIEVLTGKRPPQGQQPAQAPSCSAKQQPTAREHQRGPAHAVEQSRRSEYSEASKRPSEQVLSFSGEPQAKQQRLEYVPPTKEELEFYD